MIEDEKKDCNYCSSLIEYLTRRVLKMVISSMPSSDQNQENNHQREDENKTGS